MIKAGKHILKIVGWITISIFLFVIGFGILVYFNAENYINKNLSRIVAEKSQDLYELSFDEIDLKTIPFSITVSNITLIPNKHLSDSILQIHPDKSIFSFESNEFIISGFNIPLFLKKKIIHFKNIKVVQPELTLSGRGILKNDSTNTIEKAFREIQPIFENRLSKLVVDEISFVDANYKLYHSLNDFDQISNAQKLSVSIKKFVTDSSIIFNSSRFFESDDILIRINQFQNNLSDSIHVLHIDTLEYSLKSTDIFAHGFHLTHKVKNIKKNLFDVHVPYLHLKSKSISSFSLADSLDIQFLKFENPEIQFHQKEKQVNLKSNKINQFNLHSLIENQFSEVKIDSLLLKDANLKIYQQPNSKEFQQHFNSLTISLNGFELDSASANNTDKMFHADDLEMSVANYYLRLTDNQHEFRAKSMFASTFKDSLGIKSIIIVPQSVENKKSRTQLNVNCNALEIGNLDFKTLYHTRKLPTGKISVSGPDIKIQYHSEIEKNSNKLEAGILYNLVSAYLKGVYSQVVEVNNGNLNIQTLKDKQLQGYFETGFHFDLAGFALDSTSMEQTDKFFYASEFDLRFSDYQMKLVDNLHKINVDTISILSFDRKLQIENLRLSPVIDAANEEIMEQYNRSELYNISIPKITLWGINLRDAFFYNKLNIAQFQITRPKIYFENFGALRERKEKKEFSELYQLIFNYLSDFNIKKISAPNGNFTWINHTKKGKTTSFDNDFSATLTNFRLNENELKKQRLLFSEDFEISVKDQVFQLSDSVHILRAGEINFSSNKSRIGIKNALLYPLIGSNRYEQLSTTFQVSIPNVEINNFDFSKAYYSKELELQTFELNKPKFEIYSKTNISKPLDLNKFDFPLPAFVKSFQLNEFKINDGEVINYEIEKNRQYAQGNFRISLSLPNVVLKNNKNNRAELSTDNLILSLKDFKTPLGKSHVLKMGTLDFNRSKETISITKVEVNPFTPKQKGNRFTITAPKVQFSGFDINDAFRNNQYGFNQIQIEEPEITIEINDSIKGDKLEFARNLDIYPYVEPYLNGIQVKQLQLRDLNLNFNWFDKELIDRQFNLKFNDIDITENSLGKNLLNSEEFEIATTNLKSTSKNGLYNFTADSLIYNSGKHNTILKNINITPIYTQNEFDNKIKFQTDYLKGHTSYIELKGVDENKWLKDRIIDAEMLAVGETELYIFRNKRIPFNTNQRPPWPQDLIKEIPQAFVFDSVLLAPSTIRYNELLDLSDEPGYIEFNNFSLSTGQLSNIPDIIQQSPNLNIIASSNLFNYGLLSVNMNFDLNSVNYQHSVQGNLEAMPIKPLNAMIQKSVPISIESGEITRFNFNIQFNENQANGELYLWYNNFKISIFETNPDENKKSKLASFWANNMVLNSKSPKGNTFSPTIILYDRDPQRSIINYWWKALFSGSKETIGIKTKKKN